MSNRPAVGSFLFQGSAATNTSRGPLFEDWLAFTGQLLGGAPRQTLAMASGSITPSASLVTVDTQAAAATGNLDAIQQTNLPVGSVVVLRSADPNRVVTVRHNQGSAPAKILLATGSDLVLTSTTIMLALEATSAGWNELWRWYGTAQASWQSFLGLGAAAKLGTAVLSDMQAGTSTLLAATPSAFRAGVTDPAWFTALPVSSAAFPANTLLMYDGTRLWRLGIGTMLAQMGVPRTPFDSGEVAVSANGNGTYNHGLGSTPRILSPRLVCKVDDSGYTAANGDSTDPLNISLWYNPNSLGWFSGSPLQVRHGNTGAVANITASSWRLRIFAFL
jgi:hypothetical protein